MSSNLIPPFLMRLNGIDVNERPKFMARVPEEHHHSIYFPEHDLRIHLYFDKTTSYLPTRTPTDDDLNDNAAFLDLTPDTEEWNPHDKSYGYQEKSMLDFRGDIVL